MSAHNVRNMSDLYLELRTRIPVVAEQTKLGTQRLQDAQKRAGLSNEAVARVVPVSEKTWRRWKTRGAIPTASLPAVARALRLELHELQPGGNGHQPRADESWQRELADEIRRGFREINEKLDLLSEQQRATAAARPR
jgi:hypothetical protein